MIKCEKFYDLLRENGIDFFTGVPDSLLKNFIAYVSDRADSKEHIIAANEGGAIALAAGHYLATGKIGLVYMQNSGQGNAVNPLTSLMNREVYSIPVILLIGWRAEPGKQDEPQHVKQGKITLGLLDLLEIPYEILPDSMEDLERSVDKAIKSMKERTAPYAFVVRSNTFEKYIFNDRKETVYQLSREDAIKLIVSQLDGRDIIVSTTGKTSRELFECREKLHQDHSRDFMTVGSMGHSSQIGLGIALSKPQIQVFCLDGDGSVIMHMGSMAIIGSRSPRNFKHIVINNGAHDSVGGQPTAGFDIDVTSVARACGYKAVFTAARKDEVADKLTLLQSAEGPALLEIRVNKGARNDLGRPTMTPKDNKENFMRFTAS